MTEQKFPFGNTETEHNSVCDSMKCHYGNYWNPIIGLCVVCKYEKEGPNKNSEKCILCGRQIGIYNKEYTHNIFF